MGSSGRKWIGFPQILPFTQVSVVLIMNFCDPPD
jgi:hypothetical protein